MKGVLWCTGREFQSTPPAEARGDLGLPASADAGEPRCFNPLPPPKRGETRSKI